MGLSLSTGQTTSRPYSTDKLETLLSLEHMHRPAERRTVDMFHGALCNTSLALLGPQGTTSALSRTTDRPPQPHRVCTVGSLPIADSDPATTTSPPFRHSRLMVANYADSALARSRKRHSATLKITHNSRATALEIQEPHKPRKSAAKRRTFPRTHHTTHNTRRRLALPRQKMMERNNSKILQRCLIHGQHDRAFPSNLTSSL